jgi:hypothetical protein
VPAAPARPADGAAALGAGRGEGGGAASGEVGRAGAAGGAAGGPVGRAAEGGARTHGAGAGPGQAEGGAGDEGGAPGAAGGAAAVVESVTPVFDFPDAAAHALGQVTRYAAWRSAPEGELVVPDGAVPTEARAVAASTAEAHGAGWLPPAEVAAVLGPVGVAPVPSRLVHDAEEAVAAARELGYPVAVKALARQHHLAKSEAAGLALDVHGDDDLRATCARLVAARGADAFPAVVQSMVAPGIDVAVAVTGHPLVGPVLSLGPGGVATTVGTSQVHVLPLTDRDARRCVETSSVAPLLDGPARAALEDLLLRVGALVEAAPEVEALELNPVILSAGRAQVTDAQVWVAPRALDHRPPVRRL